MAARALIRQLRNIAKNLESGTFDSPTTSVQRFYANAKPTISKTDRNFWESIPYRFRPIIKATINELLGIEKHFGSEIISKIDAYVASNPVGKHFSDRSQSGNDESGRVLQYTTHDNNIFMIYFNLSEEEQRGLVDTETVNRFIYTINTRDDMKYVDTPIFRIFRLNITWSNIDKVLANIASAVELDDFKH